MRLTDLLAGLRLFTASPPARAVGSTEGPASRRAWGIVAATPAPDEDDLAGLDAASRASILDPLRRTTRPAPVGRPVRVSLPFLSADGRAARSPARQVDQTTCGSAVLSMLAMAGDPRLALQVARDPAPRFAALQQRVHRACARSGPVPWPMRFGTAPWAAAAFARFGGVRYTHRVVGGSTRRTMLGAAVAAASSGVPVPLFSGGDLAGGWQAAVPRHVVLLVDATDDVVRVYEPSSATLHSVPTAVLLAPEDASPEDRAVLTAALGHWPHVVWTLLPV